MAKSTAVPSYFDAALIGEAQACAALDPIYAALLAQAERAGAVAGAQVNATEAGNYWAELADKLALGAELAAKLAPVAISVAYLTTLAQADRANSESLAKLVASASPEALALAESANGLSLQAEADLLAAAPAHVARMATDIKVARGAAYDSAERWARLGEFRALCALVNVGIRSAQTSARRTAIADKQAAKLAERAKQARDRIVKRLSRALAVYGLKVDFQKVGAVAIEASTDEPLSAEEKAAKSIKQAFKHDVDAALGAICALEPALLTVLKAQIEAAQEKARLAMLGDDAEHKAGAAEQLADKLGEPAATREAAPGAVIDLVSVANAQTEAEAAQETLAKAKAQAGKAKGAGKGAQLPLASGAN